MKKPVLATAILAAVFIAGYAFYISQPGSRLNYAPSSFSEKSIGASDAILARAFSNHLSNLRVSGQGVVAGLLPEDNSGSRHQRFILKLSSGQTLLIAHTKQFISMDTLVLCI